MLPDLHLMVELDCWTGPADFPESMLLLETYLAAHGNVTLTLLALEPLQKALARLAPLGPAALPDHLVTDGGMAIHHAQGGGWVEDREYRERAGAGWDPLVLARFVVSRHGSAFRQVLVDGSPRRALFRVDPGRDLAGAAAELQACLDLTPFRGRIVQEGRDLEVIPEAIDQGLPAAFLRERVPDTSALMVCGRSERILGLLRAADHPVLLADSPMDFRTPGMPRDRVVFSPAKGPAGVLEALLRLEFHIQFSA